MELLTCIGLFLALDCAYILPAHGIIWTTCPNAWDGSDVPGFACPRPSDVSDDYFCCNAGLSTQYCCDYYDYYNYEQLSTEAIVAIVIGCIFMALLFISCVIVCIICSLWLYTKVKGDRKTSTETPASTPTSITPPHTPARPSRRAGNYRKLQNEPV